MLNIHLLFLNITDLVQDFGEASKGEDNHWIIE